MKLHQALLPQLWVSGGWGVPFTNNLHHTVNSMSHEPKCSTNVLIYLLVILQISTFPLHNFLMIHAHGQKTSSVPIS
jgi:hypothetical protein